jgi:23S rRNA (cytosine1962-C5)-methyltransferase
MIAQILHAALGFRKSIGAFRDTEALRLFYGPGESDHPALKHLAVDQFKDALWITQWARIPEPDLDAVCDFFEQEFGGNLRGISLMDRSGIASERDAVGIRGELDAARFTVREFGVPYRIQMTGTKHPGLFLDHAPLRLFLKNTQAGKRVLNLFAYTGSLSVAAGSGGAEQVTTVDLSKATIDWARENWSAAGLEESKGDFIYGDVFDWLPKFRKRGLQFDTILCDPPSFSRSKSGTFSTQKDSERLHAGILPLLKPGGLLATSINSENYPERNFAQDLASASEKTGCRLRVISRIDLPPTFPTSLDLRDRYLKGFLCIKLF